MDKSQFIQITSTFDDVNQYIQQHNRIKTQYAKSRRKLKTLIGKYAFLRDIVDVASKHDRLRHGLKQYFKAVGFTKVELYPEKLGVEDMRLWVGNRLILVEITGRNKSTCDEATAHTISVHIPITQDKHKEHFVSGLFVVNHDARKVFNKRQTNPFNNARMGSIATSHKYTITTTTDLLYAFIDIKSGKMTRGELIDSLCSFGEYNLRKNRGF